MKKPTDEQIEMFMARVLGWAWTSEYYREGVNPASGKTERVPRYCTDRNALPEVWAKIDSVTVRTYGRVLGELLGTLPVDGQLSAWAFQYITAEPRLHVIAALKALDKWPENWTP